MERSVSSKKRAFSPNSGFAMVEAIVGVVLASILLTLFLALSAQAIKIDRANKSVFEAELYLKELIEVAKDLEQSDWCELPASASSCPSGICHPEISAGRWRLIDRAELVGNSKFSRSIVIADVRRNQLAFPNEIVVAGGVFDPDTKKITAQISWVDASHPAMTLETYVYKYVSDYDGTLACP